ncbi:hypothetical protein V1477_008188 [Vespula maculifrons]|uniref:Uncharacterized protein n=2 Tax=Vespula TaxID=7451 RepID=A0A834N0P5_VESVU|nr:hypothetical protein HZH66_009204 [Vespula vulgaris]
MKNNFLKQQCAVYFTIMTLVTDLDGSTVTLKGRYTNGYGLINHSNSRVAVSVRTESGEATLSDQSISTAKVRKL